MPAPASPTLTPGRVYRTLDFKPWGQNAPRLVKRLVRDGQLLPLRRGLFACPEVGRFGAAPPTDAALMDAFLGGSPYVFTGPNVWNALALGTTPMQAAPLVYNLRRSGTFEFDGRRFVLRCVAFPHAHDAVGHCVPPTEWFVVDLFEHAAAAATTAEALLRPLTAHLRAGLLKPSVLDAMGARYATAATRRHLAQALVASAPAVL